MRPVTRAGTTTAARVMLVDDYQPLLDRLAELLDEYGIEVVDAIGRGDLVLDAVISASRQAPVDVVVMDVRLPGVDGLEATRLLRRAFPAVEVILHTAFGGCLAGEAAAVGAFAEVPKGAPPSDLVREVLSAVAAARARRHGPAALRRGGAGAPSRRAGQPEPLGGDAGAGWPREAPA